MDHNDLDRRFTFHPASREQANIYEVIRQDALEMAKGIDRLCPDGREKALAITHLEEVVFWANASVARSGPVPERSANTEVADAHVGVPLGRDNVTDVQLGGYAAGDTLVEDLAPPPDGPGVGSG